MIVFAGNLLMSFKKKRWGVFLEQKTKKRTSIPEIYPADERL